MKVSQYELMPHIKDMLNEGKIVTFKVSGTSMWPFYMDQQTQVTLQKTAYRKYDVVLAYYTNRYVLHRILSIKNDTIILRGDGAVTKEILHAKDILGKVISYETKKAVNQDVCSHRLRVWLWVHNPLRRLFLRFKR